MNGALLPAPAMLNIPKFEEDLGQKVIRKARESPLMPVGLAGLAVVCAIGARRFKLRGTMSPSVYLMQLRVAAQGTMVGALLLGLGGTMANEHLFNQKNKKVRARVVW